MNYFPLTPIQQEWKERTTELSARVIGPRAAEYDRNAVFPRESLHALRDAGLWAIRVPQKYGGPGLDLVTTCLIVEEISKKCPSTAMCYKMHLEAVEAISQIPTAYQRQRYIEPLLRGEMFAAAPGGEPHGKTGDDWTVPLCAAHHRSLHNAGNEQAWWAQQKIDPVKLAEDLWRRGSHQE